MRRRYYRDLWNTASTPFGWDQQGLMAITNLIKNLMVGKDR